MAEVSSLFELPLLSSVAWVVPKLPPALLSSEELLSSSSCSFPFTAADSIELSSSSSSELLLLESLFSVSESVVLVSELESLFESSVFVF